MVSERLNIFGFVYPGYDGDFFEIVMFDGKYFNDLLNGFEKICTKLNVNWKKVSTEEEFKSS